MNARVYDQIRVLRQRGGIVPETAVAELRRKARRRELNSWREWLHVPQSARQRDFGAILPSFQAWLEREGRGVTYRLTQMLTGHGCFGEYLNRIEWEPTEECHHCGADQDSAQHTLEECPAWHSERHILNEDIGHNLSPPAVVAAMLRSHAAWDAAVAFC